MCVTAYINNAVKTWRWNYVASWLLIKKNAIAQQLMRGLRIRWSMVRAQPVVLSFHDLSGLELNCFLVVLTRKLVVMRVCSTSSVKIKQQALMRHLVNPKMLMKNSLLPLVAHCLDRGLIVVKNTILNGKN